MRRQGRKLTSAVIVDGKTSARPSIRVRSRESLMDERQIGDERRAASVGRDRRPIFLVLHTLERGHARRSAIADDLVDDVPGGDGRAHALDFLLDVLGDDIVHEIGRGDATGEPGLIKHSQISLMERGVLKGAEAYRRLRVPKGVVPSERVASRGREALHGQALSQSARSARRLRRVPLAPVLSDDMVEEVGENARLEGLGSGVGVVCGAEVEGLAFARGDGGEDRLDAERPRGWVAVVDEEGDGGYGEGGRRERERNE